MAKKNEPPPPPQNDPLSLAGLNVTPPPMIGAGSARQPLGPPQEFYAEQAVVSPQYAGFQPYLAGDEWGPAAMMTPEDRDRLKARMNAAGLYGTQGYQSGSWTRDDAAAYQVVLESANAVGTRDADVVIDNIAAEVRKGPRVQGPRAPLVNRVSDPTTIRNTLRETSYQLTGMRLSDEEEQRLISAYQAYQTGLNQAAYGAETTGGTVAAPMAIGDFAQSQIEALRPEDVENQRAMDFMDKLLQSATTTTVAPTANYQGRGLPPVSGEEVV